MTPFDRVEAAQEYLALLSDTVADNKQKVEAQLLRVANQGFLRSLDALRLVAYNLEQLDKHLKASRKTLSNLRKLRRLILSEPAFEVLDESKSKDILCTADGSAPIVE